MHERIIVGSFLSDHQIGWSDFVIERIQFRTETRLLRLAITGLLLFVKIAKS